MIEIFLEKGPKNLESEENPTVPSPPVSGVAFADLIRPRKTGQSVKRQVPHVLFQNLVG
jgi:hypothetical protein